jgi:hypothetical protein
MQLSFRRKSPVVNRKTARELVLFCAEQLLSPRLFQNINLQVRFVDDKHLKADCGFCYHSDEKQYPRNFIIAINDSLSYNMTMRTIAHEMVHLRQYATGQLKDMTRWPDRYKWKGAIYKIDENASKRVTNKQPEEAEALELEKVLFRAFKRGKYDQKS